MRLLFALSGFHRLDRGAEVALLSVADALAERNHEVTVAGSGMSRGGTKYRFVRVPSMPRERFEWLPSLPFFRDETAWEDAHFAFNLARAPAIDLTAFDATLTCAFPFTNTVLRRARPKHVFVTQNGDWPALSDSSEYRTFACDGLVCTNPRFFDRNRDRWNCALIPNGADPARFHPGTADRAQFGLPQDRKIVLMVSAFIESKRVLAAIDAMEHVPGAHLVVAGDGPLRAEGDALAARHIPGRFTRITLTPQQMPDLYRCADVFLHMSEGEAFGNVYVEAANSGLPVVAHDYPVTRWILGDSDYLCDTRDRAALVARIREASAVGSVGLDPRLEQFTWPVIASKYEAFLREQVLAS